jgi:hypothetical protein
MNNATPAQDSRKRVRFEDNNNLLQTSMNNAPSRKANEVLKEAVVALLPAIRTLTEFFFEKVIKLHIAILHLKSKADKMKDSSTIPKSARTNFKLTGKYKESDARTMLDTQIEEYKTTYQTKSKESILTAMDLDLQSLKSDLKNTLCEAFYQIGHIFAIQQSNNDVISENRLHVQIIRLVAETPNIIRHSFDDITQFRTTYRNKFNIMTEYDETTMDATTATDISVLTDGEEASLAFARSLGDTSHRRRLRTVVTNTTITEPSPNDPLNADTTRVMSTLLYQVFSKSWSIYEHEHKLRLLNNLLQKHSTAVITTNSTDQTAALINSEPSIDPTMLNDIIKSEVSKATKELKNQINKLQQFQQRSKNSNRGDQKASAGTKKLAANKKDQQQNPKRKKAKNTTNSNQTSSSKKKTQQTKKDSKKDSKGQKSSKTKKRSNQEQVGGRGPDLQQERKKKAGKNQKTSSKKKRNSMKK